MQHGRTELLHNTLILKSKSKRCGKLDADQCSIPHLITQYIITVECVSRTRWFNTANTTRPTSQRVPMPVLPTSILLTNCSKIYVKKDTQMWQERAQVGVAVGYKFGPAHNVATQCSVTLSVLILFCHFASDNCLRDLTLI